MNKKPLIERLKTAYDRQQFSWFVIDGKGNTMAEGLDELSAREYAMKDPDYSIGWLDTDAGEYATRDNPDTGINIIKPAGNNLNADGVPITYANKDILSEEDLE